MKSIDAYLDPQARIALVEWDRTSKRPGREDMSLVYRILLALQRHAGELAKKGADDKI